MMCGTDATRSETFDLVISGAGISGLVAGIRAQQLGLRTLIIEKQKAFAETLRGEYVQPVGMAHLRRIGLAQEVEKAGVPISAIDYNYWKLTPFTRPRVMDFKYSESDFAVALPHLKLKDVFVSRFIALGGRLMMNAVVEEAEDELSTGARVIAKDLTTNEKKFFNARHFAISEGVLSMLAKKLDVQWAGQPEPASFMVGGITENDEIPEGRFVTAQSKEGLLCAFKITPRQSRVYFYKETPGSGANPFKIRRPESFLKSCVQTSAVATYFKRADFSPKVLAAPYVPRYAKNPSCGIFTLLGDAAGPSHPLGGQGMSTAAADGIKLAELLKKYLSGEINLRTLNQQFNDDRRVRYLNCKFVGEWLSFIIGGMTPRSRATRQVAIKFWSEKPEAREFCGRLFGGTIKNPLTAAHIFNIWGFKPDFSFSPITANVPSLFYLPWEVSPGKVLSDIIK
jgi:2-polyprenyl-6-methoxyphenol hydroxylase-like FAD-dependent oxidoreductase